MGKRPIKTGVNRGGGGDPPFEWGVFYLAIARAEAEHVLNEAQYHHVADQFKQLATHRDPTHSDVLDLDQVEDFHELRDKGGPLGNLNIRVFFMVDHRNRAIVVLGTIKKEADGATPLGDKVRMRMRKRRYERGEYGWPPVTGGRRRGRTDRR